LFIPLWILIMTHKALIYTILFLSILLNLIFIGRKVYYRYLNKPDKNQSTPNSSGLYADVFRSSPNDTNEIIFLGNSITAAFNVGELLPGYMIKNRGINGNTTRDILNRLDEVCASHPKEVFLMIGINDIVAHIHEKKIVENIRTIVYNIHDHSPKTVIYLQSILPVTGQASKQISGDTETVNILIGKINNDLKTIANDKFVLYIDLNMRFSLDGQLNEKYSWDGIHINAEGYQLWYSLIKPYIIDKTKT